jgi:transcriptional regulator with XRE-family HTH domain
VTLRKQEFILAKDQLRLGLGQAIAALRRLQLMSQSDLSEQLGISQSSLSGMENGYHRVSANRIATMAHSLKVDPKVLLGIL